MFILEIGRFLSPYSGHFEVLPILFFVIIAALFVATWIALAKNANSRAWQQNWQGKKLDSEHSSLTDLSYAVATKSEKAADVMPGVILIIGLLGTFIGLGLALDKASLILSSADMNNMDNSMSQLMGMMEGLGTKFKTSTWGLIAFLLLKVIAAKNGYDDRRLNWCSQRVKEDLEQARQDKIDQDKSYQSALLEKISHLTQSLVDSQGKNQKVFSEGYLELQQEHSRNSDKLLARIEQNALDLSSTQKEIHTQHLELMKVLSDKQVKVLEQSKADQRTLVEGISNQFSINFDALMTKFQHHYTDYKQSHLESSERVGEQICASIFKQQEMVTAAVDKNSQYLAETAKESKEMRKAMESFVKKNLETVESLNQSAQGMANAAGTIGQSATALESVIKTLNKEMNAIMSKLKNDLGETIGNMDQSFNQSMSKMSANLAQTIGDMNDSFKQNMGEMSSNLATATDNISTSITSLSEAVNETMNSVEKAISESLELQTKSSMNFTITSKHLNENITRMTELVEQLKGDIVSGLQAVSDSNRNVTSLNRKSSDNLAKADEQAELLTQVIGSLNTQTSDFIQSARYLVDDSSKLREAIQQAIELNKNSSTAFKANLGEISQHLSQLTELAKASANADAAPAK